MEIDQQMTGQEIELLIRSHILATAGSWNALVPARQSLPCLDGKMVRKILIDFLYNEERFYVILKVYNNFWTLWFLWMVIVMFLTKKKIISDYYEPQLPTVTASIGDEARLRYLVKDRGEEFRIKRFPDNGKQATFERRISKQWEYVVFASVTAGDEGFYTSSKSGKSQLYDSYTRLIVRGGSTE